MKAEQSLRQGDVQGALAQLQEQARKQPADPSKRIFLFQLLSVMGQWSRANNQLDVLAELDAATLPMVQTYREALRCEMLRAEVFAGRRSPLFLGEPEAWMALLMQALGLDAGGSPLEAATLREQALESAAPTAGSFNGEAFEWIADADSRIGPMLEAIVNGNYYWVPFSRIRRIQLDAPEDLRDMVWMPAQFTWANGGQTVGLIPTRYPGSESSADGLLQLARKTEWRELGAQIFCGLGQRLLATDAGDYGLLDARDIQLESGEAAPAQSARAG